jgi:hypothetical protein
VRFALRKRFRSRTQIRPPRLNFRQCFRLIAPVTLLKCRKGGEKTDQSHRFKAWHLVLPVRGPHRSSSNIPLYSHLAAPRSRVNRWNFAATMKIAACGVTRWIAVTDVQIHLLPSRAQHFPRARCSEDGKFEGSLRQLRASASRS